eukprot:403371709
MTNRSNNSNNSQQVGVNQGSLGNNGFLSRRSNLQNSQQFNNQNRPLSSQNAMRQNFSAFNNRLFSPAHSLSNRQPGNQSVRAGSSNRSQNMNQNQQFFQSDIEEENQENEIDQEVQMQLMIDQKFTQLARGDLVICIFSSFTYFIIFIILIVCQMKFVQISDIRSFYSNLAGLLSFDFLIQLIIQVYQLRNIINLSMEDIGELRRQVCDTTLYLVFLIGLIMQLWNETIIPKKIIVCSPLLLALVIRLFFRRLLVHSEISNNSNNNRHFPKIRLTDRMAVGFSTVATFHNTFYTVYCKSNQFIFIYGLDVCLANWQQNEQRPNAARFMLFCTYVFTNNCIFQTTDQLAQKLQNESSFLEKSRNLCNYRVSNTYYMKIGQFAHEFLTDLSQKLQLIQKPKNQAQPLNQTAPNINTQNKVIVQSSKNTAKDTKKARQLIKKNSNLNSQRRLKYLDSFQYIEEELSIADEKPTFDNTFQQDQDTTMNNLLQNQQRASLNRNIDNTLDSQDRLLFKPKYSKNSLAIQIQTNTNPDLLQNDLSHQALINQNTNTCKDSRPWQTTQNDRTYNIEYNLNTYQSDSYNQTELSNQRNPQNNQNYMQELEYWQIKQEQNYVSKQFNKIKYRSNMSECDQDRVQIPPTVKSLREFKDFIGLQNKGKGKSIAKKTESYGDEVEVDMQKSKRKGKKITKYGKSQKNQKLNQRQKRYTLCDICCQDKADAVIMPCGHGGLCFLCAFTLSKQTRNCHLCREIITKIYQMKLQPNTHQNSKSPMKSSQLQNQYTRVRACIEIRDPPISQQLVQQIHSQNIPIQQPIFVYYKVELKKQDEVQSQEDKFFQQYDKKYSQLSINDEFEFNDSQSDNSNNIKINSLNHVKFEIMDQNINLPNDVENTILEYYSLNSQQKQLATLDFDKKQDKKSQTQLINNLADLLLQNEIDVSQTPDDNIGQALQFNSLDKQKQTLIPIKSETISPQNIKGQSKKQKQHYKKHIELYGTYQNSVVGQNDEQVLQLENIRFNHIAKNHLQNNKGRVKEQIETVYQINHTQ